MAKRGSGGAGRRGGGKVAGSASLSDLKAQEKKLDIQIDSLNKKLANYASKNPAWNMPSGYYDAQRKKQALATKRRSLTNKIVTASKGTSDAKTNGKTFVNSFGEATKREITTSTYKNSQAKLSKEILGFVGGATKRRK